MGGGPFSLTGFWLDLRYTIRELRKDWGFTGIAVLTLALGIGANAAVFSAVHAILLRPLPFKDSSRLVNVWLSRSQRPNWHFRVPPADFAVIQAGNRVFDQVALYDSDSLNLTGGGDPLEVSVGIVSAELFPLLGAETAVGRIFNDTDEEAGGGGVVILSDGLWRRRFAANPEVLGSRVRLNDKAYQVVGVMPTGFSFPGRAELWLPRNRSDAQSNAYILARLRPSVGLALAQADMEAMVTAITNGRPNPGMRFTVEPLKDAVTGSAASSWFLLLAAVGCVLVIGCVNVSNLMLAQRSAAAARDRHSSGARCQPGTNHSIAGHRESAVGQHRRRSRAGRRLLEHPGPSGVGARRHASPERTQHRAHDAMGRNGAFHAHRPCVRPGTCPAVLTLGRRDVAQVLRHCGDRDSGPLACTRCPSGVGDRAFPGAVGRSDPPRSQPGAADERRPRLSDRPSAHSKPAPAASEVPRTQHSGGISSRGH